MSCALFIFILGPSILLSTKLGSIFAIVNHIKMIFALFLGNLFLIVFVSYFGSKLHRPKIIGIGSFVMGIGSILTALPHFFMG